MTADKIRAEPDLVDKKNVDPKLRKRKVKGLRILTGFIGGPLEWTGGLLYNPDDGGTYKGVIRLVDRYTMKVTGCIVWPLCKSTKLKKVQTASAQPTSGG